MTYSSQTVSSTIYSWYKKAQFDYDEAFLRLYIAYNAWYREVAHTLNDRQALVVLKRQIKFWGDYKYGKVMAELMQCMERLVELTQREPLESSSHWSGSIDSVYDWRSLIEFWYRVRCLIVHGMAVKSDYVGLAYDSLNIFMSEVIKSLKKYDSQPAMNSLSLNKFSLFTQD